MYIYIYIYIKKYQRSDPGVWQVEARIAEIATLETLSMANNQVLSLCLEMVQVTSPPSIAIHILINNRSWFSSITAMSIAAILNS